MIKKMIFTLFSFLFISFLAYAQDTAALTISIVIPPRIEISDKNDLAQNKPAKETISASIKEKDEQLAAIKNEWLVRNGKNVIVKTILPK
ncbi:MAG: hypothetical protein K9L69_00875 [Candidatus Omnitrophica bacterium]|nr:hypothetical protein [Candidatus Omnitrophota bacterium]MCF7894678.1 hypothetical protein [Candidatus Omnitrophota bacterium]